MSINNKRSYTEYTITQPTTDFAIGFDDFVEGSKDNILVTLNGVLVESLGYAAIRKNESTVTITPAITEGTVRLTRETDIDEPFHKFTAGALFSAKSMDENFQQVRHSQQEVRDGFVFLEYNTNGIVQASKEATAQAKAATVEATASAVRAESAADTAVQAVGSLQGVVNAATTATTNANTATVSATTAASQATTATASAQSAAQAATVAKQEATTATANAKAATVDTLAATGRANVAAAIVEGLTTTVNSRVSAVEVSQEATIQRVDNFIATDVIPIVNDAINNTAVEGGVLADTFVTVTANGAGKVARNQRGKNNDTVTPFDFGAIGDGIYHPVSDWTVVGSRVYFANLAAIQVKFPHVTSLTDSIDWVALQAFFNYCHINAVPNAVATCNAYINKPLQYVGATHATNTMHGNLKLNTDKPLDFMLHITGASFQYNGTIDLMGAGGAASARKTRHGLLLGMCPINPIQPVSDTHSPNLYISHVIVTQVYDTGVYWGNFSHFSSIGRVRGVNVGSCATDNSWVSNGATFSSVTHVQGDINQSSTLTVDKLPYEFTGTAIAYIDGYSYNINSFDPVSKTITIYPKLPSTVSSGQVWYQQGSVVFTQGNDTSNLRIDTLQAITCGIGADLRSLYGLNISTFISEFLGAAVVLTNKNNITIGNKIGSGYFEGNIVDIMYGWGSGNGKLVIDTSIALDPNKIKDLYSFRGGNGEVPTHPSSGRLSIEGLDYNGLNNNFSSELTHPEKVHFVQFWGDKTVDITLDKVKRDVFGKSSSLFVFSGSYGAASSGIITINPPVGAKINNAASFSIDASKYAGKSILVHVYADFTNIHATVITPETVVAEVKAGTTEQRPVSAYVGRQFFDTTLNKLIVWSGTAWVDSMGIAV